MAGRIEVFSDKSISQAEISPSFTEKIVGNYHGREITQKKGVQSLIADAAEELTFSVSEKVEKDISKRKISSSKHSRIEKIKELYEKYLRQIPDLESPEKLNSLLKKLKQEKFKDPSKLKEELKNSFKDITHQYLALEFMEEVLEEENEDQLLSLVQEVKTSLYETQGPEIRAGLNISHIADKFATEGLSDIQSLRDFYRDNIIKYEKLSNLHSALVNEFGEEGFEKSIAFLIEACGNDLRAQGPSISPSQLKQILDDLYRLEVIGNFHRECAKLINQTNTLYHENIRITSASLAGKVFALKEETWITSSKIKDLINSTGLFKIESKIFFLTNLKEEIRKIPIKAFLDNEDRMKFLNTIQEAIDNYIEQE